MTWSLLWQNLARLAEIFGVRVSIASLRHMYDDQTRPDQTRPGQQKETLLKQDKSICEVEIDPLYLGTMYCSIQCNMQYTLHFTMHSTIHCIISASLITTDRAYHCPVGSVWPFLKCCQAPSIFQSQYSAKMF